MILIIRVLTITSFLFMLIENGKIMAQSTPLVSFIPPPEESELQKEKNRYVKTLDSLLLEDRYRNIIDLGERLTMDREHEISQIPVPYLICAYYFIGNEERSKKLLNEKINKQDYKALVDLLTSSEIAFIKYFSVPKNREPIIKKAIQDYKSNEKATDKLAGEQIIRFSINDQIYRKLKYAFKEDDKVNRAKVFQEFKFQDTIQNAQVYAFYKKHGKYLSAKEVGETVCWYQPIILCHYDNIELRQTFFKDLLGKAVKEGSMEKTNYVHFLLRTESFTNPDFFKNLDQRVSEVRKEYDLPDYLWNPF